MFLFCVFTFLSWKRNGGSEKYYNFELQTSKLCLWKFTISVSEINDMHHSSIYITYSLMQRNHFEFSGSATLQHRPSEFVLFIFICLASSHRIASRTLSAKRIRLLLLLLYLLKIQANCSFIIFFHRSSSFYQQQKQMELFGSDLL